MSNHRDDEKSGKKNRKRLKRLYQQIREQMEFYLSDANLQKDRFLKQQMTSSADGCIDLDVFLRCNKILSLTSDMEVLTNAITTSKKLMVDKEKKRVGRLVPYSEPKDVDERTVYVECLPTETDREWIRKVFGACGKIVYISLPRYKSTGDIKGFAFVEYETMESAQKACELINHPPAEAEEKVGRFPRNKQLKQMERQVHFQENVHGRKRRASESEMEKGSSPKAKRKRTMSEGKNDEAQALQTAPPTTHEPPAISCKRRKSSDSGAVEGKADATLKETPAKEELQSSKSRRRKSSECGDAGISLESKSETPEKVAEMTSKSKKAKKELKAAKLLGETTDLKKSVKRARRESTEDVACVEAKPESTKKAKKKEETPEATIEAKTKASKKEETPEATIEVKTKALKKEETSEATIEAKTKALKKEETPKATIEAKTKVLKKEETSEATIEAKTKALKRKAEGDESSEKKAKKVKICDERALLEAKEELNGNEVGGEAGKKKKRQKKNKKTKTKDIPELRVIPKKEWLSLRSDYLKLQKANMSELKEKLKEIHNDERSNKRTRPAVQGFTTYEEKESETKKKSEPEFIEGVIVKVTTDQPITRNDLKERIWAFGSIAYIDVKDQDTSGYIRCNDQETAIAISQASLPGYAFQRLSGVDEKAYWQKLIDDRNKKHTTKTRPKQRGRDKILHKADVAYEKVKKPLHIIFD